MNDLTVYTLPAYVWALVLVGVIGLPLVTAFTVKGRAGVAIGVIWPVLVAAVAILEPLIPLAVAGGLIVASALMWRTPATPVRLARPQAFRVVGGVFLLAMALGALPPAFALPAGLGDLAIGLAAPFVKRRAALLWWNALGILDLVVALAVGALLLPSTLAVTHTPLLLIPATAVPLALGMHVVGLRALIRTPLT